MCNPRLNKPFHVDIPLLRLSSVIQIAGGRIMLVSFMVEWNADNYKRRPFPWDLFLEFFGLNCDRKISRTSSHLCCLFLKRGGSFPVNGGNIRRPREMGSTLTGVSWTWGAWGHLMTTKQTTHQIWAIWRVLHFFRFYFRALLHIPRSCRLVRKWMELPVMFGFKGIIMVHLASVLQTALTEALFSLTCFFPIFKKLLNICCLLPSLSTVRHTCEKPVLTRYIGFLSLADGQSHVGFELLRLPVSEFCLLLFQVLTFDGKGVSGHANHTAIYKAVR